MRIASIATTLCCFISSQAAAEDRRPIEPIVEEAPGGPRLPAQLRAPAPPRWAQPITTETKVELEERWYGWQTLAVDAASLAVLVGAASADSPIALVGAGGLLLGGPLVHFIHGNWVEGLGSLAVRGGTPIVVSMVSSAGICSATDCGMGVLIVAGIGFIVGSVLAVAIDSAALAWEKVPVEPLNIAPQISVSADGRASFGLSARF